MKRKFRCCFPECKFKHLSLLIVMKHMIKEHKLNIVFDTSSEKSEVKR